ncbi:hypothetical protein ONZ45_g14238 [Pleurotus djamor]|nr:hypothetical protein ONZ45_g14238 [Pleurotus djamor]
MSSVIVHIVFLAIGIAIPRAPFRRLACALLKFANQVKAAFFGLLRLNFCRSSEAGKPLSKSEVVSLFPEGSWQRSAFDSYTSVLVNEDRVFPCVYATKGYNGDEQRFVFVDNDDLSDTRHIRALADSLSKYLRQARSLGPNTSLVLLARETPSPRSMEEYNNGFWKLLDGLARLDKSPWPSNIPQDIDNDRWCLCFGGEPFFSVIQTPAHQARQSRYAKGLTVVFQPKWIFDILFSSDAKRAGALGKVRSLLSKYDSVPVSPELKNYGDEGSRESKQYFLLDENVPADCPFDQLAKN